MSSTEFRCSFDMEGHKTAPVQPSRPILVCRTAGSLIYIFLVAPTNISSVLMRVMRPLPGVMLVLGWGAL